MRRGSDAPEHLLRQPRPVGVVERRAHEPLLDELRLLARLAQLELGVDRHRRVEHLLVEEGHAHLEAVRHRRLVRAQAVVVVQVEHLAHALLVQLDAVRRLVGGERERDIGR